jgi:hypothetical protein
VEHLQAGAIDSEEGVEEAFELIGEIPGKVEKHRITHNHFI